MDPTNQWICRLCGHSEDGPPKPKRGDIRRYCLKCSKQTGRLVRRFCPALEKTKAQRKKAPLPKPRVTGITRSKETTMGKRRIIVLVDEEDYEIVEKAAKITDKLLKISIHARRLVLDGSREILEKHDATVPETINNS